MISDQDMEHLKLLARLELSADETQGLKEDLNKTLGYFEQIRDLDLSDLEELARPIDAYNVFRADSIQPGLSHRDALALAVQAEEGFYRVPRTVETGE